MPSRSEVAHLIDHTLLKPAAGRDDVQALMAEAADLGTYSVCVSPSQLPLAPLDAIKIATVVGFPSGAHLPEIKAAEAAAAVRHGVDEVDMVINLATLRSSVTETEAEIRAVREACPAPVVLKVIIESAALTDEEIVAACRASEAAGADFVKTSTGFDPAGGATVHAVRLMARTVGGRLGVKASGGIRTGADALAMIEAGATRLGVSGSRQLLAELS